MLTGLVRQVNNMSDLYALTDRRGDIGGRWTAGQAKQMYAAGVKHAALNGEIMQVWVCLLNGEMLRYDGARTRKLTDKIVEYRNEVTAPAGRRNT